MRIINAFIAADAELAHDRDAFIAMIDGLNHILAPRDVQVKVCDYDPAQHDELLGQSEIALVLYHTKCGAFASKAVDDAYERTVNKLNPHRLYIFFKEDRGCKLDPEFVAFRDNFVVQFEHFFCRFENVDTLKLNFLLSLENLLSGDGAAAFVTLDGTKVKVEGLTIGDFRSLPMVAKNEGLSNLFVQMDELQKMFTNQKQKVSSDPTAEDSYQELLDISMQVNELQDRIDRELALSFGLAKRMSNVTIGESNEILARARSCMEQGKIKEAIEILDSADTEGDRERLLRRKADEVDEAALELKNYAALVDLELFRIDALMRYEAIPLTERAARAKSLREVLVSELEELRQNTSCSLVSQVESLLARVKG